MASAAPGNGQRRNEPVGVHGPLRRPRRRCRPRHAFKPGQWHAGLANPGEMPPKGMFPDLWLMLCVFVLVAAAFVADSYDGSIPIALSAPMIARNTLGPGVVPGPVEIRAGLSITVALWLSVLVVKGATRQAVSIAGKLFSLCLAWVTAAFAANSSIWARNPSTI
jgi:tryptophan-rich sensory protein